MFQCRAKEKQGGTMWNTDKPTRSSRLLQTLETSQECSFSYIRFCVAQSINFFWALCGQWVLQRFMKKVALFADDKCYNFSWLTFTISNDSAICIHIYLFIMYTCEETLDSHKFVSLTFLPNHHIKYHAIVSQRILFKHFDYLP